MSEDGFEYIDDQDIADKKWWEQDGLVEFDPSDETEHRFHASPCDLCLEQALDEEEPAFDVIIDLVYDEKDDSLTYYAPRRYDE